MNFKRRKRKPHKGCCGMCMLQTMRCLHHRIPTRQEVRADESEKSEFTEDDSAMCCGLTCECGDCSPEWGGIQEQEIPADSQLWDQISALKELKAS